MENIIRIGITDEGTVKDRIPAFEKILHLVTGL